MYQVKLKGLNIRQNERDVADGFLQESINMQWRDDAYRPIPERLKYELTNVSTAEKIILHKVSDEDVINVLIVDENGILRLNGIIDNGVYSYGSNSAITGFPTITDFDSLSFTILNGLVYFMSSVDEFYYRLQYNETDGVYEVKDMYAWKDLIPFYPTYSSSNVSVSMPKDGNTHHLLSLCGLILVRFTLVLNTGEEVLHSPIYSSLLIGLNRGAAAFSKGDIINNIHTLINTNLEFLDTDIFEEEISAINIYASIPKYVTEVKSNQSSSEETQFSTTYNDYNGYAQELADSPFYLVKTLDSPSESLIDNTILLYAGSFDNDIDYDSYNVSKINLDTIAAGQVMPIDNFSYHKVYGEISSNNGRLIINKPKTVLSKGHIRAIALYNYESYQGFRIDTEDGKLIGESYSIDKSVFFDTEFSRDDCRGVLSYPDISAYLVGVTGWDGTDSTTVLRSYKLRSNKSHNLSCNYNWYRIGSNAAGGLTDNDPNIDINWNPSMNISYEDPELESITSETVEKSYKSNNRIQFSEAGEFSIWPAINSYRVGNGEIKFVGDNSIDPANADYLAPLIIGTTEGVYTVNFDTTGQTLIQSITKAANMPAISSENIQIDQALVYVSDKGLIAINNGQLTNLTKDYFPDSGSGGFSILSNILAFDLAGALGGYANQESVLTNYDLLTSEFEGTGNIYTLADIISFMKGAKFAYDARRNNLWCSNPSHVFSLIFNLESKQWDMSTFVFNSVIDLYNILQTDEGDVYSRFLITNESGEICILSGEDSNTEVEIHMLTRALKLRDVDSFKKIQRFIVRCELYRESLDSHFSLGLWGKQDVNISKTQIPISCIKDNTVHSFPNNVRQDIPVGRMKGKYKTITALLNAKCLPLSSISGFDITALKVNDNN